MNIFPQLYEYLATFGGGGGTPSFEEGTERFPSASSLHGGLQRAQGLSGRTRAPRLLGIRLVWRDGWHTRSKFELKRVIEYLCGNRPNQAREIESVNTSAFVETDPTKGPQLPSGPSTTRSRGVRENEAASENGIFGISEKLRRELFVAQGNHGFNVRGTARGQERGKQRDGQE
jgi:hypothetical protein